MPFKIDRSIFTLLLLSLTTLGLMAPTAQASDIYVSPTGNDKSNGSKLRPYATLEKARDAARLMRASKPSEPVTVWIVGGDYVLPHPLEMTEADSGTPAAPTVYRPVEDKTNKPVRIVGARPLKGSDFHPVTDPQVRERIAPAVRDKVVVLDLKALNIQHAQRFPDVFNDSGGLLDIFYAGRRMPLSRFPKQGFMTMKRVLDNAGGLLDRNWRNPTNIQKVGPNSPGGTFVYREEFADHHKSWAKVVERGVWLKGYWRIPWENEAIRVKSIDTQKSTVTFAKPVPNGIGSKYQRPEGNGQEPYWLLNLLEEVTEPGEWAVDFQDQKLYFLPPGPLDKTEVLIADESQPLIQVKNAHDIVLRGLTLEGGLGHGITVSGGQNVLVAGCTIRNMDRYAVTLEGGTNHAVQSCDMYDLGAGGVWLGGGDEKSTPRIPANHRAVNNHIHHFAQIERVYSPAVNCGYTGGGASGHHTCVGMLVAHNLIHDTPHVGVLFGSWDSVFEYNEIFRYCSVSNDMGGFYAYDYYGKLGNQTFRYNLIHSTDDGDGIYFDHDHPDMKVYSNILCLNSKGKRGTGLLYKIGSQAKNPQTIDCQNNIVYHCNFGGVFVAADPSQANIANNVSVMCKTPWTWRLVKDGKEVNTPTPEGYPTGKNPIYTTDPGFVDAAHFDFRLKPDSVLLRDLPGFKPIPVEKIGLYKDEYRRKLPTAEEIDRYSLRTHQINTGYQVEDRK